MTRQLLGDDPGLSINDDALAHLRQNIAPQPEPKPIGIRIHVKKAGCSGFEYDLSFAYADSQTDHDFKFVREEVIVLIDQEIYFKFFKGGAVLEYTHEGLNEGLQINNPNVEAKCGCGESFTLASDKI